MHKTIMEVMNVLYICYQNHKKYCTAEIYKVHTCNAVGNIRASLTKEATEYKNCEKQGHSLGSL